mmetsp:Transcript_12325/g.31100  ORF Transcript_12325/g.31100 Transcript_12325/m.31100 type:complete len:188 (-) Transcript_12325:307-870(-)
MAPPTVLIPLATASEELEAIAIANVLRRANCTVTLASTTSALAVTCARNTTILCDALLSDVVAKDFDLIAVPGGMPGARALGECEALVAGLRMQKEEGRWVAAICAAPAVVLKPAGVFPRRGTCYPAKVFRDAIAGAEDVDELVVVDEEAKVVTSQGPGTAIAFALKLVEILCGKDVSETVAKALLV